MADADPIREFAEMVNASQAGVAFTGAGMSTESGIPDFRSPGGVWSRHKVVYYDDFLQSREERVRYWQMRAELYRDFAEAKPNPGH